MYAKLRIVILTLFGLLSAFKVAADMNYQDWWWDSSKSGMGFNIGHQGDTLFASWFMYDRTGNPSFLNMSGKLVEGRLTATLYRSNGPQPGPAYNPANVRVDAVGTASINFLNESNARFEYNYDGNVGQLNLTRFTFRGLGLAGRYRYVAVGNVTQCVLSAQNNDYVAEGYIDISADGGVLIIGQSDDSRGQCQYSLPLIQSGTAFAGVGSFSCVGLLSGGGVVEVEKGRSITPGIAFGYSAKYPSVTGCVDRGYIVGVQAPVAASAKVYTYTYNGPDFSRSSDNVKITFSTNSPLTALKTYESMDDLSVIPGSGVISVDGISGINMPITWVKLRTNASGAIESWGIGGDKREGEIGDGISWQAYSINTMNFVLPGYTGRYNYDQATIVEYYPSCSVAPAGSNCAIGGNGQAYSFLYSGNVNPSGSGISSWRMTVR